MDIHEPLETRIPKVIGVSCLAIRTGRKYYFVNPNMEIGVKCYSNLMYIIFELIEFDELVYCATFLYDWVSRSEKRSERELLYFFVGCIMGFVVSMVCQSVDVDSHEEKLI